MLNTYPIVVVVGLKGDTWQQIRVYFCFAIKTGSSRLTAAREGLSLYSRSPSVSQAVRLQEFVEKRSIPARLSPHEFTDPWRSAHGTAFESSPPPLLACGEGAAEVQLMGVQQTDALLLLSLKFQIFAGWVEEPCCLNWERQPSFSGKITRSITVHVFPSLPLSLL